MEQSELRDWEARCIQEEPPACRAGCPLAVDARGLVQALAAGDVDGARGLLEKSMPLAGIVAHLCEAPCEDFCLRRELGGAVAIGELERFCLRYGTVRSRPLVLPPREKRVTVLGSGLSSLTAAFDLAKKGYPVTMLHLPEGPGSWLRDLPEARLPKEGLLAEISRLAGMSVQLQAVARLDAAALAAFPAAAVYLGQDDQLDAALLESAGGLDRQTFACDKSGWFSGGLQSAAASERCIRDVSQGREAAVSIDRFLQGVSLTASRIPLRHGQTGLYTDTSSATERLRVAGADPGGYSPAEAAVEASRCLNCQCLECVTHCVYLAEFGSYPKTYARRVYNNSAIVKGVHQANTFINSCSLCRQCEVLCPHDFSMADLCLDARRQMVREGRMPPSAHWFALEEMHSACTEAAFSGHAPGQSASRMVFFPGCQLAGMRPQQSLRLYQYLREEESATGFWLSCCAAPAHWAGQEEEFASHCQQLRKIWQQLGQPLVVTACATCRAMFIEHLPEISVDSVWNRLSASLSGQASNQPLALTDPCTARNDSRTRTAVRGILAALGQPLADLAMAGEKTECCGFGGLMASANPQLAKKVAAARTEQSAATFLTYCAMCRDQLARTGKPVLHLLDLLFPELAVPATAPPVSLSARRQNRRQLLQQVRAWYPNLPAAAIPTWQHIELLIVPAVAAQLEERRILEDDLRQVLYQAEQQGRWLTHVAGQRVASARFGQVMFWVQYRCQDRVFDITAAWSHRMTLSSGGGQ